MRSKHFFNKSLLFSFLVASSLHSNEPISLEWLETKPRTITKDFYIWQFLQQDITPNDASIALGGARNVNNTLFTLYAKKINHDETYAIIECQNASALDLLNTSANCVRLGLTPSKALKLNYQEKNQAIEILQDEYPSYASLIEILNAPLPFTKLLAASPKLFFEVFNVIEMNFIEQHLNYKIPISTINKLALFPNFNLTLKRIITNKNLNNLQESLLESFDTSKLNTQSLFFLSINALKYEKKELALSYLEEANKKSYYRSEKDKINFWLYTITQEKEFLEKLSNSYDVNMYALYAKEKLNKPYKNIMYSLPKASKKSLSAFDSLDPFAWIEVLNNTQNNLKYEELFNTKQTQAHWAYMLEKENKYQTFYYITPYSEYLKGYSTKRKALIYALAKKESHFIPTAVSSAYALGVMQIMPFLSKAIAKELNVPYILQEQLTPATNIKYANHHLNYLEKQFNNPLFIAYAYNGGAGFMKRTLEKGFIEKNRAYEPFLSMELMSNDESREYGKQVLANYYIYINHLDKKNPIKLSTLLENL
ncbi:MAG: lytic transglycosylase domain-containing protein [Arcobacteraceae bacterium]